jgi:hypothetical protein
MMNALLVLASVALQILDAAHSLIINEDYDRGTVLAAENHILGAILYLLSNTEEALR